MILNRLVLKLIPLQKQFKILWSRACLAAFLQSHANCFLSISAPPALQQLCFHFHGMCCLESDGEQLNHVITMYKILTDHGNRLSSLHRHHGLGSPGLHFYQHFSQLSLEYEFKGRESPPLNFHHPRL